MPSIKTQDQDSTLALASLSWLGASLGVRSVVRERRDRGELMRERYAEGRPCAAHTRPALSVGGGGAGTAHTGTLMALHVVRLGRARGSVTSGGELAGGELAGGELAGGELAGGVTLGAARSPGGRVRGVGGRRCRWGAVVASGRRWGNVGSLLCPWGPGEDPGGRGRVGAARAPSRGTGCRWQCSTRPAAVAMVPKLRAIYGGTPWAGRGSMQHHT